MIFVLYTFCGKAQEEQHSAAYSLLDLYLGHEPEIKRTDGGKPFIESGPRFSISHTGGLAVCAVSTGGQTGVDCEKKDRRIPERVSANMLGGLTGPDAVKKWTETEALAKYIGCGVYGLKHAAIPEDVCYKTVEKNGYYITVCVEKGADVSFVEVI